MKKNIVGLIFICSFIFCLGCNESQMISAPQIKVTSETQKLIDSMPASANTDYTVYLSMAGDCRSGSIFVTVETAKGTERRLLKEFKSEDGSKIEGKSILKYIEECNELHNKVNKVKAESAEIASSLNTAKDELATADRNVIKANDGLNSSIKSENDSKAEIERLKALLVEQEVMCINRISSRKDAEKNLSDLQNVLLAKKSAFNVLKSRIESVNEVILGIVEQIGQANGKNKKK